MGENEMFEAGQRLRSTWQAIRGLATGTIRSKLLRAP
jgi:hypothetical protein